VLSVQVLILRSKLDQQESAVDLSPDSGGSADRRDRRPTRRQHNTSHYHRQNYILPSRYENNLNSDPGPNTSSRNMSRNESRQAGKRPLRALTPQEKIDAINRVHNGESKAAVARDIGVPESTLRGWCKAEDKIMSQVNNIKTSGTTLPGTSLAGYEHILTSSSDNSNNSAVGGSSSRSTPTTQATMLGLSTSAVTERTEEFEVGPSHKRIKLENSSGTTMANNISSVRAPVVNDTLFNNLYNMPNDANKTVATAFLNSLGKEAYFPYPGYTNVINLINEIARTHGPTFALNILKQQQQLQQQLQQQQQQQLQQLQQQTNNTLLNGNKRKHSAPGLTSTMDIPKPSSRTQNNQSPNMEKSSGNVSQLNYEIAMPSTSSSDPVANVPQRKTSRKSKSLSSIIDGLYQPYEPPSNSVKAVTFDVVNNNNNDDDMDNEIARKYYPGTLPPGCNEMVEYCTKLLQWLHIYGSPISTMKQIGYIQRISTRLQDWIQKSKKEVPQRTNGIS